MPPTMMTRSVGRPAVASRGGGTGGQAGRGGGRTRGRSGNQVDGRNDGPGGQIGGQGSEVNGGVDGVHDFSIIIAHELQNLLLTIGDVRNATEGNDHKGCTYKEFLACSLKEYDGKRGAIVYTCYIKKIELVHDMSGCRDSQRVKYTAGSFVGKGLTWWNSKIHTRGQEAFVGMSWEDFRTLTKEEFCPSNEMQKLVPHLVTPKGNRIKRYVYGLALQIRGMVAATEPRTIQKVVQLAGTLTDEALRNGSIKNNPKKRGNGGEPCKDRNGRDDNKRTRTKNAFAMTINPVRGGYTHTTPKCTTCSYHHPPKIPYRSCFNCNHLRHFANRL
ncbi:hypothetical protein Tco_1265314 [Tanacetum coccineum]